MYRQHICYLNNKLLEKYLHLKRMDKKDVPDWIRKCVHERLGLALGSVADIAIVQEKVNFLYYNDIGEWLAEIMRNDLRDAGLL